MKRLIITIVTIMVCLWLCSGTAHALPEGAVARLGKARIEELAFSPDGSMLAVATTIGIYLYDPFTYKEMDFLETNAWMTSVAFSPDGVMLASGSRDATVKLWDVDTRQEVATLSGYTDWVYPLLSVQMGIR